MHRQPKQLNPTLKKQRKYSPPKASMVGRISISPSSVANLEKILGKIKRFSPAQKKRFLETTLGEYVFGARQDLYKKVKIDFDSRKKLARPLFANADKSLAERTRRDLKDMGVRLEKLSELGMKWRIHYSRGLIKGKYSDPYDVISHSISNSVLVNRAYIGFLERLLK